MSSSLNKASKKFWQRGDTIVEVMIALALIGGALVASYGVARRSLSQIRDSQERSEMLRIAQSQLETTKQYIAEFGWDDPANGFRPKVTGVFPIYCIRGTGANEGRLVEPEASGGGAISSSDDTRCAINERGEFYMDCTIPTCGFTPNKLDVSGLVDSRGYVYRAATIYHRYRDGVSGTQVNEFYTFAGRSTASSLSANARANSVVNLFYRQHPPTP